MKVPEKYSEIYAKAKNIDIKLESQTTESILKPRKLATRNVELLIKSESQINELKDKIKLIQIDIETAKNNLSEYGIEIP